MQTQIIPNNKLASIGTIGLLFLAGIAGMVFLLPLSPAHAAGATVTLSTITSTGGVPTELTGVTSGIVGTSTTGFLTITGQGFASNAPISITSTSGTTTTSWFLPASQNTCSSTFAASTGGIGSANSLVNGFVPTGCLTTTAAGSFKTTVQIPALPGGAETIVTTDGTTTVSTPFTINPSVTFTRTSGTYNFGFPEEAITGTLAVTGFGSGEAVTITTPMWTTTPFTCTTGTTPEQVTVAGAANSGAGSCTVAVSTSIADTTGGAKTITATGGTSALTATTSFTVKPWAAFYNSIGGVTTFSFIGSAPTSLVIEAHGLTAGTIAPNSITIGGVATAHPAVTVGTSGAFINLVASPSTNVPFGNAVVVIQGTTFSYAAGNIASGVITTPVGSLAPLNRPWGGALISSILGTGSSTAIASLDAANYKPGVGYTASFTSPVPPQNQIGLFGYGFISGCSGGGSITITPAPPPTAAFGVITYFQGTGPGGQAPDCNGASFDAIPLLDTPWSTVATPTVAASYTATVAQAVAKPANILSPSFGITPWFNGASSTVDYTTANYEVKGHGFGPTDVLTVTIGALPLVSGASGFGTCGPSVNGSCETVEGRVPDLAAGPRDVVLTGSITAPTSTTTLTGGTVYDPRIYGSTATNAAMSIVSGPAGSSTILRTATSTSSIAYGVHGLLPNQAYSIVWNGLTGPVIGTFTSTATGGIPVPGVQFTLPADTSGIHIIDLQPSYAVSVGTSFIFANNLQGDFNDGGGADIPSQDLGLGSTTLSTNYGDMLFNLGTSLVASPTVASVGGSVSLSGNGLAANTLYDLGISIAGSDSSSPAVPSTCSLTGPNPALPPQVILGSFTSTSSGGIPAGALVSVTDMATFSGLEQGTLMCIFAETPSNFGTTNAAGSSQFLLQASANLNMTSAPAGHNVVISAHALNANRGYSILFAPYTCGINVCGTVVGAMLTNAAGAAISTFTVPSVVQTSSGAQSVVSGNSYAVQLQEQGVPTNQALAAPSFLTVGPASGVGGPGACNTTSCMTAATPTSTHVGTNPAVQTTYTNTSNAPVTAIVYGVVHNSAGQTVYYTTATITVAAGGSATAYDVIAGLPSGTYSVTIFAVSTSGTAISTSSTVTVTI